ncbi:VWA domain-containing protein [Vallitalea pronyensis]|uniref:VWA domain-containing protein n=1 Tax=Vallitalea pronyensis TaxID=1348613 RepID=A0A8J8SH88_9FIRM|nr:VWA domain-containing protein [Vallitalea pronyensis]QUI23113.1 VWA domain-containing protein [Vallitalea pronyensis]
MRIEFTRAWLLLLYPLMLGIVIFLSRKYHTNKVKKYLILTIRGIFLLCLILALADMSIVNMSKDTTTIFLSDLSNSVSGNEEDMKQFILEAMQSKQEEDRVASVVFGKDVELEGEVTDNLTGNILDSPINTSHTDIEQGLVKSMTMMPKDTNKRIVLLTDGKENKGDVGTLVHAIKEQKIDIKVKLLESQINDEVYVDSFYIPQKVNLGEQFQVHMDIYATVDTETKVTLIADGEKLVTETMSLNQGSNKYVLHDTAKKMGFVNYELLIEPVHDTMTINNSYSAYTLVETSPKILILYDEENDAVQLEKIADSLGLEYDSMASHTAPTQLENLLTYKSIMLCNVSADKLDNGFLEQLEHYVKDFGGGMVAVGGENAFALGGYYKTPLETVLPVNMHMRGIKDKPSVAMMLVIDKSGSMAGINLKLAKEAAVRTLDVLEDRDEIGVVAFDDKAYNVVDLQKAENRESIQESILGIQQGGGTSILPALREAYEKLSLSKAEIKHVILLTDGQAENTGYEGLLTNMNDNKITLSTVGIGSDTDIGLLSYLASSGNGRFYLTKDGLSIPRIFAKEAFLATRTYLNNMTFTPEITSYHSILSSVYDEGLPPLHGYVGTSPKDAATVLLTSPVKDPILVSWQYGLGKTVAWTSDLSGQWSREYNAWGRNHILWQNIIHYTIENYSREPIELESTLKDGEVEVTLTTSGEDDQLLDTSVQVQTPSNKNITLNLEPVRKGVYRGRFLPDEIGSYMLKGVQKDEEQVLATGLGGITVPYSEEYKVAKATTFKHFVDQVGGAYIQRAEDVFGPLDHPVKSKKSVVNGLLIMAMIIWIVDIAMRRLNVMTKLQRRIVAPMSRGIGYIYRKAIGSNRQKNKKVMDHDNKSHKPVEVIEQQIKSHEKDNLSKKNSKPSKSKEAQQASGGLNTDQLLGSLNKKK